MFLVLGGVSIFGGLIQHEVSIKSNVRGTAKHNAPIPRPMSATTILLINATWVMKKPE